MRRIPWFVTALVLVWGAAVLAEDSKGAKEDQGLAAVKQLQPLIGTFEADGQGFDGQGKPTVKDHGTIRTEYRAGGHVVTMDKSFKRENGSTYEDLMVFYYDASDQKIHAMMYSLADNPRKINVTVDAGKIVLDYAPLQVEGQTMVTRETITWDPKGALHWLIDHQLPDGSYEKHREIEGMPKK